MSTNSRLCIETQNQQLGSFDELNRPQVTPAPFDGYETGFLHSDQRGSSQQEEKYRFAGSAAGYQAAQMHAPDFNRTHINPMVFSMMPETTGNKDALVNEDKRNVNLPSSKCMGTSGLNEKFSSNLFGSPNHAAGLAAQRALNFYNYNAFGNRFALLMESLKSIGNSSNLMNGANSGPPPPTLQQQQYPLLPCSIPNKLPVGLLYSGAASGHQAINHKQATGSSSVCKSGEFFLEHQPQAMPTSLANHSLNGGASSLFHSALSSHDNGSLERRTLGTGLSYLSPIGREKGPSTLNQSIASFPLGEANLPSPAGFNSPRKSNLASPNTSTVSPSNSSTSSTSSSLTS